MDRHQNGRWTDSHSSISFFSRIWNHSRWVALPGLLALGLAAAVWGGARPAEKNVTAGSLAESDEPTLPKVLELEEESSGQVKVTVLPAIEGLGRVKIQPDQAVQALKWKGNKAPEAMKLRKSDGPRQYHLNVTRKNPKKAAKVTVGLTVEDEDGRTALNVSEEITLAGEAEEATAGPVYQPLTGGHSSNGTPVVASVPADAPAPKVQEAVR